MDATVGERLELEVLETTEVDLALSGKCCES